MIYVLNLSDIELVESKLAFTETHHPGDPYIVVIEGHTPEAIAAIESYKNSFASTDGEAQQ